MCSCCHGTLLSGLRRGELIAPRRSNEEELALIAKEPVPKPDAEEVREE